MPDIDFQKIELNVIPSGELPVFYASQYETARPFIADLKWGSEVFTPGEGCYAEIDIRKVDNNLVVITDDVVIDGNEVSVILPQQAVTCVGKNLAQVKIYGSDDVMVAALNFFIEVQPDPLSGGVDSETAIDNIESQIAEIVPQVIGDDYYDKDEVDALLNGKADAATTYTKTEVDNALALKANSSDLATVATTGSYDDLTDKPTIPAAQIQSDYAQADNTKVDYIKNKPDINAMINAAIIDIMPVGSAGPAAVANFDTDLALPLESAKIEIKAQQASGTPTPANPLPITGWTESEITVADGSMVTQSTHTIALDRTVYGGYITKAQNGNWDLTDKMLPLNLADLNWYYIATRKCYSTNFSDLDNDFATSEKPTFLCEKYEPSIWNDVATDNTKDNAIFSIPSDNTLRIRDLRFDDDVNSFKASLSDCGFYYNTKNPTVYSNIATEQITALIGINNIFADTGNSEVSFKVGIQKYIDSQ
jgi:hypothetical protein